MAFDGFFNKSSFIVQPLEVRPDVVPDQDFTVHFYVFDRLSMYGADDFSAKYYVLSGRNKTEIDSSDWTTTKVGEQLWKLEGNISSDDWDGNKSIIGEAEIDITLPDSTSITVRHTFDFIKGA